MVEVTYLYNINTIAFSTWKIDDVDGGTDYDPFVEYVQVGSNLQYGLLAWMTVAVHLSSDHSTTMTAYVNYYKNGCYCRRE